MASPLPPVPERLPASDVARQAAEAAAAPALVQAIETMPGPSLLLNDRRQIVAANRRARVIMRGMAGELIGLRPGDAFGCADAACARDGCGSGPACGLCGLNRSLAAVEAGGAGPSHEECSIACPGDGPLQAHDFEAGIGRLPGTPWTLVAMRDIGHERRRRVLEQVFFHDVLNSAGAVASLADLARAGNADAVDRLPGVAAMVVEEIRQQQALAAAETGELRVRLLPLPLDRLCAEVAGICARQPAGAERTIDLAVPPLQVRSDAILLGRVVANLLRNALEATPAGGRVRITAMPAGGRVRLAVANPGELAPEVRLSLFRRSFTTKRHGHGLGTWSVKLFAESYLEGRVGFVSGAGTTEFWVELPAT